MTKDEVLMMADVLSREKELEKDVVFLDLEAARSKGTRKHLTEEIEVRVSTMRHFASGKSLMKIQI